MTIHLSYDQALADLTAVVAERGEDFVYEAQRKALGAARMREARQSAD